MTTTIDRFLEHLGLEREPPSPDFLHRIVCEHQLRVPFETLTKLIDFEPGLSRGDFMPSFSEYVERIVARGGGGLCWTLARGLRELLDGLGFDAALMYMHPGHCCVRVELEVPYYADVGYAAPLFQAYPLFESFSLETDRGTFNYHVGADGIHVVRNPGPSKWLDPTPRHIDELRHHIAAANNWDDPQSFLNRLSYARFVDGEYTSLRDEILTRYRPGGAVSTAIARDDVPDVLSDVFGADPALYSEAVAVQAKFGRRSEMH